MAVDTSTGTKRQYGFVIDHRTCIGCHACTVACKAEHDVPLGVVPHLGEVRREAATFPDTRRYFSVMRCNHCDDAPCVQICPTTALYRREDGIVDFDADRCIGCKSCMQACPYDALYIDPRPNTAAKCNFCAHRVEVGLEPACVIVCPTQAIVAGDLDDPTSEIAGCSPRRRRRSARPEQGTGPKVFYLGADEAALDPLQVGGRRRLPADSEVPDVPARRSSRRCTDAGRRDGRCTTSAHPRAVGLAGLDLPLDEGDRRRRVLLAALLLRRRRRRVRARRRRARAARAGGHRASPACLLVADLKQPERFLYLFTRPQLAVVAGARARSASSSRRARGAGVHVGGGRSAPTALRDVLAWRADPGRRAAGRATPRSCSASARAATSGRARCCCRTSRSARSWPAPARSVVAGAVRRRARRADARARVGAARPRLLQRVDRARSTSSARHHDHAGRARGDEPAGATCTRAGSGPAVVAGRDRAPCAAGRARSWSLAAPLALLAVAGAGRAGRPAGSTRTSGCAPARACR